MGTKGLGSWCTQKVWAPQKVQAEDSERAKTPRRWETRRRHPRFKKKAANAHMSRGTFKQNQRETKVIPQTPILDRREVGRVNRFYSSGVTPGSKGKHSLGSKAQRAVARLESARSCRAAANAVQALPAAPRRHQCAHPPLQLGAPAVPQPAVFSTAPQQRVRQVVVADVLRQATPRPPLRCLEHHVGAGAVVVVVADKEGRVEVERVATAAGAYRDVDAGLSDVGGAEDGLAGVVAAGREAALEAADPEAAHHVLKQKNL